MTAPDLTPEAVAAGEIPRIDFTSERGLISQIDDERSVRLHVGCDQNGVRRWAILMMNGAHETVFGMSDEAMVSLIGMYMELYEPFKQTAKAILSGDAK